MLPSANGFSSFFFFFPTGVKTHFNKGKWVYRLKGKGNWQAGLRKIGKCCRAFWLIKIKLFRAENNRLACSQKIRLTLFGKNGVTTQNLQLKNLVETISACTFHFMSYEYTKAQKPFHVCQSHVTAIMKNPLNVEM